MERIISKNPSLPPLKIYHDADVVDKLASSNVIMELKISVAIYL